MLDFVEFCSNRSRGLGRLTPQFQQYKLKPRQRLNRLKNAAFTSAAAFGLRTDVCRLRLLFSSYQQKKPEKSFFVINCINCIKTLLLFFKMAYLSHFYDHQGLVVVVKPNCINCIKIAHFIHFIHISLDF